MLASELPLVSIVIPCFKQAQYLPDAIESCLGQTYPNIDIYVVNDGSPDNTSEVANRYPDRVRLIEQQNSGVNAARNAGILISAGEFVAFVDADDVLHPTCIEERMKPLIEDPSVGSVSGWYRLVDPQLKPLPDEQQLWDTPDLRKRDVFIREMWSPTCGYVVRRRAIEVCGPFDPMIVIAEDWDLQMRLARKYRHAYIAKRLADYRQVGTSASRNYQLMFDCIRQVVRKNRAYAPSRIAYILTGFLAQFTQVSGSVFAKILREPANESRWKVLGRLFVKRPSSIYLFFLWILKGIVNRCLRIFGLKKQPLRSLPTE